MKTLPDMNPLSKQEQEKCLLMWGGIPLDTDWIIQCKLFIEWSGSDLSFVSEQEKRRKDNIREYLKPMGILYS